MIIPLQDKQNTNKEYINISNCHITKLGARGGGGGGGITGWKYTKGKVSRGN